MDELERISGAGGGGGKKPHTPVEQPNNLQSFIRGRILDLLAYGPIKGLVNGLQSVYLDDTPVENPDGTLNFEGIDLEFRTGTPDQEFIPGFRAVENTTEINTLVLFDNPPVRTVSNLNADALLVTVQVAGLAKSQDNGDVVQHSVAVSVDVRRGAGAWTTMVSDVISGKTTSGYPRTYRVKIPDGTGDVSVRVSRGNKESSSDRVRDQVTWTLLTEVIDKRFSYPSMALAGISVNSRLFGSSMPARSYDLYLSVVDVPSNYDPETRVYTGLWNGTFKKAWTDNPAWAYYDLATHPIIGAGLKNVDKFGLYQIAKYCDELVPDGYGGMEPRFTINTVFSEQEDAYVALNTLAGIFRGMTYWGTNTVVPVADMPSTPKRIVSPANVIEGDFNYVGTSDRERHSVAVVMWSDPKDGGKMIPEVYEDPESIEKFGWRETRVTAVGCNSRGQALRLAKWILYSERMETQTLSYKATMDHATVRPGDIIRVADPFYQGARMAGRVLSATLTKLELDNVPADVVASIGGTWYLSISMPDQTIHKLQVSSFQGNTVNVVGSLSELPTPGAIWGLSSAGLDLPLYRVAGVKEDSDGVYAITATEYDPNKYSFVELGLKIDAPPTSLLPSGPVAPPLDLSFEAYKYFAGGSEHQGLVISWTPPKDVRADTFMLDVQGPSDTAYRTVYNGPGFSYDLKDAMGGQWSIRVRSYASTTGIPSEWVFRNVQVAQLLMPVPPDSVIVVEKTFEITLSPVSAYPSQMWEFWRSDVALSPGEIETNAMQLSTGTYLVDVGLRSAKTYFYFIRGVNQYGKSSWFAAQGTTIADFEDIMNEVKKEITSGETYQWLNQQITTVSTQVATEVSTEIVDQKVADLQEQINNLTDALAYDPTKAYVKYNTVRVGNDLWQAKGPVPADPTGVNGPPNGTYWLKTGEIVEQAGNMAAQVEENRVNIEEVDGQLQSTASKVTGLIAQARDDDGEGALQDVLGGIKARAQIQDRINVVAQDGYAMAERVSSMAVEVGDNKAAINDLDRVVADEKTATAERYSSLKVEVDGNKATADSQIKLVADEQKVTAQSLQNLTTDYNGNKAQVQSDIKLVSDAQSATAQSLTTLTTDYNGNKTAVQQQITAVSDAQAATAQSLTTLTSDYNGNKTTVQQQLTANANATTAQGQTISTLQTTVGQNTAAVQQTSQAVATLDGKLKAMYGLKVQLSAGGKQYTAGMGIDITTSGGITQSQIFFQADRFALLNVTNGVETLPFLIDAGSTYINVAMIKTASIDFLKISDTLQSTNYVANSTGWKLWKNGTFELNGPVAGGGRMRITNQLLQVFDAAGTLRVRLGIW